MKRTAIAYWLIPAEPERAILENLIAEFAGRYNAAPFEPHVTIHVGSNRAEAAEKVICEAAASSMPFSVQLLEVGHSAKFTQTLFVRVALSTELRRLNEIIRGVAQGSSRCPLEPHLSLLYKKIPVSARRELSASVKLPVSQIVLHSIKAVRCASPTRRPADVVKWCVLATAALSRP